MPKDVCTIELPEAGTTQVIKLEPGQANTLSFEQGSIVASRLTAEGAVEMDLINGSKVVIENFRELAYSNESCGRDTIIQLTDNSIIYPEEMMAKLADAQTAAEMSPAAGAEVIGIPVEMIGEVNLVPGETYQLGFDLSDVENMKQSGDDLVITFNDGKVLTLNDFYTAFEGDLPPSMTLADGTVVTPDNIFSEYSDDMASHNAADIAPAAGPEPVAEVQQVAPQPEITPQEAQEMAQAALEAAEIEPAAGVNPAGGSAGRGYGFQSSIDAAALNPQPATGPIAPTQLAYELPELREVTPQPAVGAPPVNDVPILTAANNLVDESRPLSVNGIINVNYGGDGPGTITAKDASTFTFGGSVAGGALTSKGDAVTVTQVGNVFTGTAGGRDVFTLTIEPDGRYNFTLLDQLDHADATNPNDVIQLGFGITATDSDGDMAMSTLTINVYDDGPRAADDTVHLDDVTNVATGNVLTNDTSGFDDNAGVQSVSFNGTTVNVPAVGTATINGTYGTLVISANGDYTYTRTSDLNGADNFTYVMHDNDGDTATANLYVTLDHADDLPDIDPATSTVDESDSMPMVTGQINVDYLTDGPGSITPKDASTFTYNGSVSGGTLTSKGEVVTVTLNGNTYTGTAGGRDVFTMTINTDGSYKFTLLDQLDHADGTDPNDGINLVFGVTATDADGDMTMSTVTIDVRDDVPVAVDDVNSVPDTEMMVTGNILTNDSSGYDEPMSLVKVSFNGTEYSFAGGATSHTITGVYGVLTINSDGTYKYVRSGSTAGTDVFDYMIRDNDGDMDSAKLTIDVVEGDTSPVVVNSVKTIDETDYNNADFVVNGTVNPNFFNDGPGTVTPKDASSFNATGSLAGGNLTSHGEAVTVTLNGNTFTGATAGGREVFTLTVNPDGTYTFTAKDQLDHADGSNANDVISLQFGVTATDADGDMGMGTITINVRDDAPVLGDSQKMVDETNLDSGNVSVSGTLTGAYGEDGPGQVATTGNFTASSPAGAVANISSEGVPVTVTSSATGYSGYTTTGVHVFELVFNPATGGYTFTQFAPLDHPNAADPNDPLTLNFDFAITDYDGDSDTGTISIIVKDDGPVAVDDALTVNENGVGSGNVLTNDDLGVDLGDLKAVVSVEHNGTVYPMSSLPNGSVTIVGQYGTLVLNTDGSYTYTANNVNSDQVDHFTYTYRDSDGDTTTADLDITVKDQDTTPTIQDSVCTTDETFLWAGSPSGGIISLDNKVVADFKDDAPGTFAFNGTSASMGSIAGGTLTSNGSPVTFQITENTIVAVSADGRTIFETTLNMTTGEYHTDVYDTIDHADGTDMNDLISLKFGVDAIDSDGDRATANIVLNIYDDAPIAQDDGSTVVNTSVSGNVLTNDYLSQDEPTPVIKVTFNGVDHAVTPGATTTINGVYGTLVIGANGAYTYTSNNSGTGVDHFTYMIRDYDGDMSTAKLDLAVNDIDTTPIATQANNMVDETNMHTVSGNVSVDYQADGPGTVSATSAASFTSDGSLLNGNLTSHGTAVNVSLSGNTYTGTAGGRTVFTLVVNANGSYTFTQMDQLDHADPTNPNDVINLHFGYTATDSDGDVATSTINIAVKDDGPAAVNDTISIPDGAASGTGNVLTNDTSGYDDSATVIKVTFNGTDYNVSPTATTVIQGLYGTLEISHLGSYVYTPKDNVSGTDTFTYMIRDYDGDTATAKLDVNVSDADTVPTIDMHIEYVDETNLPGGPIMRMGNFNADFKDDGPGTYAFNGTVMAVKDSLGTALNLTSGGKAVDVSVTATLITGTSSDGRTIFTATLDPNTGKYVFNLFDTIDHPDASNPNDVIWLKFGVDGIDADGDRASTFLQIDVADDGPVAHDDVNATVNTSVSGNVLNNDELSQDAPTPVIKVSFNGTDYAVNATGSTTVQGVYGTLVIKADGSYTYTSKNTGVGTDHFTYMIRDYDGDTSTAKLDLSVGDLDTTPTIQDSTCTTDETYLWAGSPSGGVIDITNTIVADFKADGPGTFKFTGTSGVSGSVAGGSLTSHGQAVSFQITDTTIKAVSADGRTIFETVLNPSTGQYNTKVYDTIDHADGTNMNDLITFNFGVMATDSDGDSATGKIILNIYDDAPIAQDDGSTVVNTSVSGNVLTNDYVSQDEPTPVIRVNFNGTNYNVPATGSATIQGVYGTLVIKADGSYTYTSKNTGTGVDHFTYTIRDYDGDTSTAKLDLAVNDIDTTPIATQANNMVDETNMHSVSGTVSVDYKADGPGTVSATSAGSFSSDGSLLGGALTSKGQAVTVSLSGNTYTGTAGGREIFTLVINANGSYTFTQKDQLDHADGANPNDVINLHFGYKATDSDGDVANSQINIAVKDDAPVAHDDSASIPNGANSVTGNVLTNDTVGYDEPGKVIKVTFNGTDHTVSASGNTTIVGAHGTLVINANGAYTYTSANASTGTDQFTYMMRDNDGDTSTANLNLTVGDVDTTPIATQENAMVDETNMHSVSGTVDVDYKADGPGTVSATSAGSFSSDGSLLGGALTSKGQSVSVSLSGNTYTGTAGGRTVFTLQINSDGTYTFNQLDQLDHADKNNPNDVINLHFGYKATDTDGDTATSTINIAVKDDAPVAHDDSASIPNGSNSVNGNVLTNDSSGFDDNATVIRVSFNGTDYTVPSSGTRTITGDHGTLVIKADGSFTYTSANASTGTDHFTYMIQDHDGDMAQANLDLTVGDLDTTPTVQNSICTTDETYLWSGSPSAGVIELTNTIVADFKADGPGTFKFNGGSSVAGSVAGGSLTSHGQAVTFQITNTTIKAVSADGRTIFETTLNANTGEYRTQVYDTIDHADGNNTNDLITFNFGVTVTDSDGDSANANVILEIYDDAPIAVDDGGNTVNGTISGNVMVNDYVSQDDATIVTKVSFNGTDYSVPATGTRTVGGVYGTLVIKADGSYTYTSKNTATGVDNFTYTIRDYDGDTSTAKLGFAVNDIDTTPIATNAAGSVDETATRTYNGTVNVDYQADGVGTVMPTNASSFNATGSLLGGALTSKGQAVTVSLSGDTYTGMAGGREVFTLKINSDSTYTFTLKDQLDHADGSNANDVINLAFGYKAVDTDGDTASATITIAVKDDVPVARDDTGNIPHGATSTTGNVLANDSTGFDEGIVVSKVNFGGSDHAVAASGTTTIQGTYGTLVIKADGSYTYTTKNTATGTDHFTYTIHDHDGDAATANLNLTVQDTDATPTITTTVCTTDETFLWAGSPSGGVISLTNTAHVDYGGDGPGTLAFTGSFQAVGSLKNNALTSDGYPINVNVTANSVTGTSSDGRTIFTISLNQSTGAYSIRVFDTLDHADGNNMNDLITFNIGIKATDADGDVGTGTVVLEVYDDAPIAINDGVGAVSPNQGRVDGNVFTNDYVSVEGQKLTSIRWGSTANHSVGTAGFALLGLYGTLYIYNNGQYTYIAKNTGQGTDTFTYTVTDGDGDIATAQLSVLVQNGGASTLSSTSFAPTTSNVSGSEFVADDDMTSSSSNAHQTQGLSSSDPTAMDSSEVLHHDFLVQPEGRTVIAGTNAADTIQGSAEDEVIEGKGGSDNIHAGDGNDVVYGGAGNDVIYGDDGADIIYDGAGADIVHGGAGDDILVVGGKAEGETGLDGANDLWGDGGADTFLFAQGSQIGTNTIHDFSTAEGDVVDLSDFLHNYDPVTQSIDAFVFQRETSEGTVISVDVNGSGDAAKAVDIVVLDNVHGHDIEDLVLNAQKVQDAA